MEYSGDDNKPVRPRPLGKQDKGMQTPAEVGCLPGFYSPEPLTYKAFLPAPYISFV